MLKNIDIPVQGGLHPEVLLTNKTHLKKEVIKYLLVGQRVWQLAFSNDQKTLLSTNGVSNDVSFINVDKLKVEKSVKVGRFPWGVVVSP